MTAPLKILMLSTPVGPLGSGLGGGVELTLRTFAQELGRRGHCVHCVAPEGSVLDSGSLVTISGNWQTTAQSQGRETPITMPKDSVLAKMWDYGRQVQAQYDVLVNFAYDWLPFYLTPFFDRPIAHLVSMGSLNDALDLAVAQVAQQYPGSVAVYSRTQAETFAFPDQCTPLASGLDLSLYEFCAEPEDCLGWVGRIAPEKGLEDAIAAAQRTKLPLKVWGAMPDEDYWNQIRQTFPDAPVEYGGFLSTRDLQRGLRRCRALIMTPRWVEAFGIVAIEALACGVPVIAYRRGGPTEIIREGKTGWLVEPDRVEALVEAIARIDQLDRAACRAQAEAEYSLEALGDRVEAWLRATINNHAQRNEVWCKTLPE